MSEKMHVTESVLTVVIYISQNIMKTLRLSDTTLVAYLSSHLEITMGK